MTNAQIKNQLKDIPTASGVYQFFDASGLILYIGKARDLRHRVLSYFLRSNLGRGLRVAQLVDNISAIEWQATDSEIEALLLEARLIQKYKPKYNIVWRDDKSYLHVEIDTKADFPTIRLVRKNEVGKNKQARYFGPYTSSRALRLALKFIRRMLPYCEYSFTKRRKAISRSRQRFGVASTDSLVASSWFDKPCLYYHLGLCPGICAGDISRQGYRKQVRRLTYFFDGRKDKVIAELEREMKHLSRNKKFEEAVRIRDRYLSLCHLKDISLMRGAFEERTIAERSLVPHRIEAYDVSSIFGKYAVGAMVVFVDGQPVGSEYKRFKIRSVTGISDVSALVEVLRRRFGHSVFANKTGPLSAKTRPFDKKEWPLPNLIILDGGKPQLNAAIKVLTEFGAQIPVLAVAKGRERRRADQYYYGLDRFDDERLLRQIRDEAHRFAISYYRTLHRKGMFENNIKKAAT